MSDERKDIAVSRSRPISVDFSTKDIDLSGLTPEARAEIEKYAATKKIDLMSASAEMQRDIQATSLSMHNVADVTRKMSESGDAVTIRQTINNTSGKVEIITGNTEEAKRGQTSSSGDKTWMYVVGGIAAAIVVALILSNGR